MIRSMRRIGVLIALGCASSAQGQAASAPSEESLPPLQDSEAHGRESELDLFQLENTLNAETKVASNKPQTVLEAPAILTVITRQQMLDSGARDLLDVLIKVPGFSFASDIDGAVSLGVRGNWAQEGKVLLLVDGQELNDLFYGTLNFGSHIPVELIQKIEIIRGPGSAAYGGHAEFAVINIVTQSGSDLEGVSASGTYGQFTEGDYARRGLALAGGHTFDGGFSFNASAYAGEANRSASTYTDALGDHFQMNEANQMKPVFVSAGAQWRDLKLRFLFDDYQTTTRDGRYLIFPSPAAKNFITGSGDLTYDWKISDTVKLTPTFSYRWNQPWNNNDPTAPTYYNVTATKTTARAVVSWDALPTLNLSAGVEGYYLEGWNNAPSVPTGYSTNYPSPYLNLALFGEGLLNSSIVNVLVGGRYEHNSIFGDSAVPRVALTKALGPFHLKGLFSGAFRTPDLQDVTDAPNLKPEHTWSVELEAGYQIANHMFFSVNGFDIIVSQPIVYYFDPIVLQEGYRNETQTGSLGAEADFRLSYPWATLDVNYSYYSPQNQVPDYSVPGNSSVNLAFPSHKATLSGTIPIWKKLSFSPSAVFMSERYGYYSVDEQQNPLLERLPASFLLDAFVNYRDLGTRGLDLGIGIYNILGTSIFLPQAYNGGHAPLPTFDREVMARLSYAVQLL